MKAIISNLMLALSLLGWSQIVWAGIDLSRYRIRSKDPNFSSFNRDHYLRYRGVGPECDYLRAIRAMLGDPHARIESMLTTAVKYSLMGKALPFNRSFVQSYYTNHLQSLIQASLDQNDGEYYTNEVLASGKAVKIVEQDWKQSYSDADVKSKFLDYFSGGYYDWPNDPRQIIFSTVYMEIAANYSPHVVALAEKKLKSIDLNYYNYAVNGKWIRNVKPWPDKGEFITAVEISAEDIIGYEIRDNYVRDFDNFNSVGNNLKIAFYQYVALSGNKYVLAIKGNNEHGIYRRHRSLSYAQSNIDPNQSVPSLLSDTKKAVQVYAVIALCPTMRTCWPPSEIFKKYNVNAGNLPHSYLSQILKIKIGRQVTKIFMHDNAIPAQGRISKKKVLPPPPPPPKILNTQLMHSLVNQDKASDALMNYRQTFFPRYQTANSVTYQMGDVKLQGGDTFYFIIPKPFNENASYTVASVELTHRAEKAGSQFRAALSPQFYTRSLKQWRTSGDAKAKGKVYSVAQPQFLTDVVKGWGMNEHYKFPYGPRVNQKLHPSAFRLISISRGASYLRSVKITFQ